MKHCLEAIGNKLKLFCIYISTHAISCISLKTIDIFLDNTVELKRLINQEGIDEQNLLFHLIR